ncbi:hypothetical protein [Polaromonas sp.]
MKKATARWLFSFLLCSADFGCRQPIYGETGGLLTISQFIDVGT